MGHVRSHLWAAAARGSLGRARMARMDAHADQCPGCATARERVLEAHAAFADIRATPAPRLGWEHIGARIYWETSPARRGLAGRRPRRRIAFALVGCATLATAAAAVYLASGAPGPTTGAPARSTMAAAPIPASESLQLPALDMPAQPAPLAGLLTFARGQAEHNRTPLDTGVAVGSGDHLVTSTGDVAVQFGAHTSFTLGPESALELVAFDERRVELALEGEIVIQVAHRAPEQSFAVNAGGRQVVVRGTSFSVAHRSGQLRVVCAEGAVTVAQPGQPEVRVQAGRVLEWRTHPTLSDLDPIEAASMAHRLVTVPAWTDAARALEDTSILRVTAPAEREVEVDGRPVGMGSFAMRVLPGRHHVAERDGVGTWHELDAGAQVEASVVSEPTSSKTAGRKRARAERWAQLDAAMDDRTKVRGCVAALDKQNLLHGAYIEFDLGVDARGTITYLNIASSNLPDTATRCVRDVVDRVAFPPGAAADVRYRLSW